MVFFDTSSVDQPPSYYAADDKSSFASSSKSGALTLQIIRPEDTKGDRAILHPTTGDVLYRYRSIESHLLRGDIFELERVLSDGTTRHLAQFQLYSMMDEVGVKQPCRTLFHAKNWWKYKCRFIAEDGQEVRFAEGWSGLSDEIRLIEVNDGRDGEALALIKAKWKLLFSSRSTGRGFITLYKPGRFVDEKQRPTAMLDQLVVYFFAYHRVQAERNAQASAAAST